MIGKHLLANVYNILNDECLEKIETIQPLMIKIIEKMKLNVVGEVHKQFEPVGATLLYLLAESHLSVHTFVEEKYCAIDLYCCSDKINMEEVLDIIFKFFNGDCIIRKQIIDRFKNDYIMYRNRNIYNAS